MGFVPTVIYKSDTSNNNNADKVEARLPEALKSSSDEFVSFCSEHEKKRLALNQLESMVDLKLKIARPAKGGSGRMQVRVYDVRCDLMCGVLLAGLSEGQLKFAQIVEVFNGNRRIAAEALKIVSGTYSIVKRVSKGRTDDEDVYALNTKLKWEYPKIELPLIQIE